MALPLFTVPLADVERNDLSLQWDIPAEWLDTQLADTEATSQGRSGVLTATLAKNGREVLVQARAKVEVVMPCARTLDPVPLTLEPEIYLLLAPRSSSPGPGPRAKPARAPKLSPTPPAEHAGAAKRAKPRGGRDAVEAEDDELSADNAARDTFEGDRIVLDDFVREHIVLELPLFPLRSDLRSEDSPAIGPPAVIPQQERGLDPRLAPLAAIASKLREKKE